MAVPYLDARAVRRALPMPTAIDAMRDAFRALGEGRVTMPPRQRVDLAGHDGTALIMPAHIHGASTFAIKTVNVHPGNAARGLPLVHGLVQLFDAGTGRPLAVLDAAEITAIRTAAVSALATDHLARRDADTLAIYGSGVQARTHLDAIAAIRPIVRVRIHSPTRAHRDALARDARARHPGLDVAAVDAADAALDGASIVCTVTTSPTPVFDGVRLAPGTHVNAVGSFRPTTQEVDADTIRRATVFVDQRAAVLEEAGDLLVPIRDGTVGEDVIRAELGDVVLGRHPGRTRDDEITYFKSCGLAVEDALAAHAAWTRHAGPAAPESVAARSQKV